MTLSDLIEKLDAATEGSRELDAAIWITTLPRAGIGFDGLGVADGYHFGYTADERGIVTQSRVSEKRGTSGRSAPSPHYPTSLDDALTLVPDGRDWCVQRLEGDIEADVESGTNREDCQGSAAKHPALALCIAALKARAALSPSS